MAMPGEHALMQNDATSLSPSPAAEHALPERQGVPSHELLDALRHEGFKPCEAGANGAPEYATHVLCIDDDHDLYLCQYGPDSDDSIALELFSGRDQVTEGHEANTPEELSRSVSRCASIAAERVLMQRATWGTL